METSLTRTPRNVGRAARRALLIAGSAAVSYAAYAAMSWLRYGHAPRARPEERDALLDRFMPEYDVVARHRAIVAAPADVTLAAARDMDLQQSGLVRAIFRARQLFMRGTPAERTRHSDLVSDARSWGWEVLAEVPGREVVLGAVTQPWKADVEFCGLAPEEFLPFNDPGYVKIAWTIRADPMGPELSALRFETRAVATDPDSRARFRRYWALVSPGVHLIRRVVVPPVKRDAEERALLA